ncbi:MAG: dihydropteroate synthase [Deltaproteobacteria bacterium]|nr:dihydropteroate synthase [Deltaproteobacteria bacterium]
MIIVGENINASIPRISSLIQRRDTDALLDLAQKQADAGVDYIDVNVGNDMGSREGEVAAMQWAMESIQGQLDIPLVLDSADPAVLEAGLKARDGRSSLINSTKGEDESLRQILPLSKEYGVPLVALAMDENGIPKSVEERMHVCGKISGACEKHGVSLEDVFFDPLVLPISTDTHQAMVALKTVEEIKERFPMAKTIMGLSNVSFGLPGRAYLNAAFMHMAIYAGLDAAIVNPLHKELIFAVKTADVLAGNDRRCRQYMRFFRDNPITDTKE